MHNFFVKTLTLLKWIFLFLIFILLVIYFILNASLPDLSGTKHITILNQPVTIERDAQGIPTIHAKHRQDTAFALGYVHAQERYFQMDLLRRSASGELAELLGDGAFERDKKVKLHRFKQRAQRLIRKLPKAQYTVLIAYANGVNSGLEALTNDPYQYLLIGQLPKQWEAEDSLLCIYAMYFDLNDELGERKMSLAVLRDELPKQWFDFLTPEGGIWDAAMDGGKSEETELRIPEAKLPELFLSGSLAQQTGGYHGISYWQQFLPGSNSKSLPGSNSNPLPGSNSWAIDASLTPYSSAMLANDMHLTLRMPNIWYRASWYLDDGRRVTGVTLPGVPAMIVGSNENIAWGFANSYGDWGDIITLKTNENNTQYLSSKGWTDFTLYNHVIVSSSGHSKEHITIETDLGPVIGKNHKGELMVHQWIAYAPRAVNMNLLELEKSKSVSEALAIAPTMGLPPQSMIVADNNGHIGWTIAGPIPKRVFNATAQQNNSGWLEYQAAGDYPRFVNPGKHRLWAANNRLVSGKKLSMIGFEGGDLGARAQQIRNDLLAKEQFKEADLLAIQLDERAVFLQRWKQLLIDSLEQQIKLEQEISLEQQIKPEPIDAKKSGTSKKISLLLMADVLKKDSGLSAHPDSVAYGLVKSFRQNVVNQSVGWIFDALEIKNPGHFKRSSIDKMIEYPVWALISKKPEHLIPAPYSSWNNLLIASARKAYNEITDNGKKSLAQQTWGKQHKIEIRHPLSAAIPGLGLLLDMPDSPLSGDRNMPKVETSNFGASMRMVVSPGQEAKGIMHMPGGQSSHPLSSYYSKGHQDWLDGNPSSFLPGKTKWVLKLKSLQ